MNKPVHLNTAHPSGEKTPTLLPVITGGESFFRITDVDAMPPFLMSIVSDADHWLFVTSNGGISAGRKDADHALFPYCTDDKIAGTAEITGSKTIIQVYKDDTMLIWEPFSVRGEGQYTVTRNLYKSRMGNKLIFEEVHPALQLSFQYEWSTSRRFGLVKRAKLVNNGATECQVRILDGLQNLLPYGVESDLQNKVSNLVDAYKHAELVAENGLAILALSAIIVDKAEPSEALKANVVWGRGFENPQYLLSTAQLDLFRKGLPLSQEDEVKGKPCAYFMVAGQLLQPGREKEWLLVANVNQDHAAVAALSESLLNNAEIEQELLQDIAAGTERLLSFVASADGIQATGDALRDARHYSNVLFNIMRGGVFDENYTIRKTDFIDFIRKVNIPLFAGAASWLNQLPETVTVFELKARAEQTGDADLVRLSTEYLPLHFSRRHGDPSRPWNRFSINSSQTSNAANTLDYEGNWRDIFQNWEALAMAYPCFLEGMIFKFLNATTFDGYNPYRITKDGFDWETIEPDNPWSYIGYWGDHQVIYLLKLLELLAASQPEVFEKLFTRSGFVYAAVPYKIKSYEAICADAKNTIVFDQEADKAIRKQLQSIGADGALLCDKTGEICRVNFMEKLLAMLLAKLSNFIPGGGIWMNTQRPEWNDANNALVGNGVSVVTLCYLRRFLFFFQNQLTKLTGISLEVSAELIPFFNAVQEGLELCKRLSTPSPDDAGRKDVMDQLGKAGSDYRLGIYENGFSGNKECLLPDDIKQMLVTALRALEQTVSINKRPDQLYHAYNLLYLEPGKAGLSHLSEMLEGQVAALSSGYLSAAESGQLLDALAASRLYRPDQNSYLLYPDKKLPGFLEKNSFPEKTARQSKLLGRLLDDGNTQIIKKDCKGIIHFNGDFRNAEDLGRALRALDTQYQVLVTQDREAVLSLFESIFRHREFTGRSGTFYGYEGLGSIYWHMVSKLLLAVQETAVRSIRQGVDPVSCRKLIRHYYTIAEGIGIHKPPFLYGAFPTDPYSHTPLGRGAQQPGMTGQVKEDILCRITELGITFRDGCLGFEPLLLRREEFLPAALQWVYTTPSGKKVNISLPANSLFFTCCGIPVIYIIDTEGGIELTKRNGRKERLNTEFLNAHDSAAVFQRTGEIELIKVYLREERLWTDN